MLGFLEESNTKTEKTEGLDSVAEAANSHPVIR
jgi:hypothetical protein